MRSQGWFYLLPAAIDQIWRQCQFVKEEEEEKEETEYFVLLIDGQTVVLK